MKIPVEYIIELGMIRMKDRCAKCGEKMDIEDYHIQLCENCRMTELDNYALDIFAKDNQTAPKGEKK